LSCGIEGDGYASIRCQEVEYAIPNWQILRTSAGPPLQQTSPWEIEDDESVSIFLEEVGYGVPDRNSLRPAGEQRLLRIQIQLVSNKSILAYT
jgi:hypothetical protein